MNNNKLMMKIHLLMIKQTKSIINKIIKTKNSLMIINKNNKLMIIMNKY